MTTSEFPRPYPSQYELRGDTYSCYGSDFRNVINYTFNNQGYRSSEDFNLSEKEPLIVCLGSSITNGHGLELGDSFSGILAKQLNKKLWNLGQGCFRSSNQTILEQVEFLAQQPLPIDLYVIQFTHINRQGNKYSSYLELDQSVCVQNFLEILKKITKLLKDQQWCWLLTDYSGVEFPDWVISHPNKIVIDPDIIDHIDISGHELQAPSQHALKMLSLHPGTKWHQTMANQILNYIDEHQ